MALPGNSVNKPGIPAAANKPKVSDQLLEMAGKDPDAVINELGSSLNGLSTEEAGSRLKQYGQNEIAQEKRQSPLRRLLDNVRIHWSFCWQHWVCFPF
jgi:magnesium-transporting ATPase (P-type)